MSGLSVFPINTKLKIMLGLTIIGIICINSTHFSGHFENKLKIVKFNNEEQSKQ